MRRIEYAVQKQTIANAINGEIYGPEFLEQQGRESILGLLGRFIVFSDHRLPYWTDRYWYFDVEAYQKAVSQFGVRLAHPVMEPFGKPTAPEKEG